MPLIVITVGLGILVLVIGSYIAFLGSKDVSDRIRHYIESPPSSLSAPEEDGTNYLNRFRYRYNMVFAVFNTEEMQRRMIAANWPITASEFYFIQLGVVLLTFLVALLVSREVFPAIGLAVFTYLLPGFFLFQSIQARQKRFQDQLIDSLTLIRGAIEAGYSFQQALNVIIQEIGSPTSEEFRQVRREVELGLPLSRALANMANRMESDDFDLVVTVVNINMQVGGSLSTILNVAIETIRQRVFLFSEIRALTAYAKYAGYLLTLLPVLVVIVLSILSPTYWSQLLQPGLTRYILIYSICSVIVGNIILRSMSRINV